MLKILGYPGSYSVAPDETIDFHVSAEENQPYEASLVRVICGDCNPEGPGLRFEKIPSAIDGHYDGLLQHTDAGSYMTAHVPQLQSCPAYCFHAMIWPTLISRGNQTIYSWWDPVSQQGTRLYLESGGVLAAEHNSDGKRSVVTLEGTPLLERQWYSVGLSLDHQVGVIRLWQIPSKTYAYVNDQGEASASLSGTALAFEQAVVLAATPRAKKNANHMQLDVHFENHFDGKIDAPTLSRGAGGPDCYPVLLHKGVHRREQSMRLAQWDFSVGISGVNAHDLSSHGNHGALHNCPARGMKGWNWSGEFHRCYEHPEHYGAVHFHHDDLYDADWDIAFSLSIPADMKSGAYAVRLHSGPNTRDATCDYYVPFFVRPPRRPRNQKGTRGKVAFLAPTASYIAYANHGEHITAREAERCIGRLLEFGHADLYLYNHPEIGGSVYDSHADGSAVIYSSRLRPVLNFTSQYHSWLGGHGSSLWQYNADTHLLTWLDDKGIDYDVITDEDMHLEGAHLLEDYQVILTGTHPEYYSGNMWTALKSWIDTGGRLMYLGANGFYWHSEFSESMPGCMEIRKAEDGTRTCEPEPGEYYHSFSGELSGLYRRKGHAPNEMCGLGFVAQGFDVCSYYRLAPDAGNPRAAFIFDGVDEDIIGNFGLIGGGAAGLELDAINTTLGSPPNILRLATSENHSQQVLLVNEEFGIPPMNMGGDQNEKVRADLAFYETPAGGAVFSVGSISWCGSLLWNNGENNVSLITENVLRRFMQIEKFTGE